MTEPKEILTQEHVKTHATSKISQLKADQRKELIYWLFEENHSYRRVEETIAVKFKKDISRNAIMKFYHEEQGKRKQESLVRSVKEAQNILKAVGDDKDLFYDAMLQLVGQIAFQQAGSPERGKKPMYKMLMQAMPILLEAHKSRREQQKVALERERWEFDVVRMCHNHFRELQNIIRNQNLDEPSRLEEIRRRLFGKNLLPEKF